MPIVAAGDHVFVFVYLSPVVAFVTHIINNIYPWKIVHGGTYEHNDNCQMNQMNVREYINVISLRATIVYNVV